MKRTAIFRRIPASRNLTLTAYLAFAAMSSWLPLPLPAAENIPTGSGWSDTVNGLQARLLVTEGETIAGSHIPKIYLELHNVSDVGNPMTFTFNTETSIQYALRTTDGQPAPKPGGFFMDGTMKGPFHIVIPHGGILKFPVTWTGYSITPNFGTMIYFESAFWEIPYADRTPYFLSATLTVPETERDAKREGPRWHGTIHLPGVPALSSP